MKKFIMILCLLFSVPAFAGTLGTIASFAAAGEAANAADAARKAGGGGAVIWPSDSTHQIIACVQSYTYMPFMCRTNGPDVSPYIFAGRAGFGKIYRIGIIPMVDTVWIIMEVGK